MKILLGFFQDHIEEVWAVKLRQKDKYSILGEIHPARKKLDPSRFLIKFKKKGASAPVLKIADEYMLARRNSLPKSVST